MIGACGEFCPDPEGERRRAVGIIDGIVDKGIANGTAAVNLEYNCLAETWELVVVMLGRVGMNGVDGRGKYAGICTGLTVHTELEDGFRWARVGIAGAKRPLDFIMAAPDAGMVAAGVSPQTARSDSAVVRLLEHTDFDPSSAERAVERLGETRIDIELALEQAAAEGGQSQ